MNIFNLGWHCFRLVDGGVSLVFDPLSLEEAGGKAPRMQNDIVLLSSGKESDYKTSAFTISSPGEYEVKDVFVYGFETKVGAKSSTIYLVDMEDLKILHLGGAGSGFSFSADLLERLSGIDVLFIPVGGGDFWTPKKAIEIINELEPRIIIPMGYQESGLNIKATPLADFIKEIGGNYEEVDKLKVVRKELPEDSSKFVIIKKS